MISDLKKIPLGWIKVKFGEIAENITDRIDNPKESKLNEYIGLDHIDTDEIRIKRFGSTEDVEATKFLCKKGDIIFGKRNAYLRKVAVSDRDAVVSAHSMVLRPTGNKILPEFLPCFMQSSQFWKTAQAISEGSMSPTIKWKTLSEQEFWIPSILEQKSIATILWAIEDNQEKTEKLIQVTEKLIRGLNKELLTKGMRNTKFKKTQLGMIPEKYNIHKLEELCLLIRDGTHFTPTYMENGIPFLRVTDIQSRDIDWKQVKYISQDEHKLLTKRVKPQKGDILLSKNGTIGITKIVDWDREFSVFVSLCIIRPNLDLVDLNYLNYFLNSDVCYDQIKMRSKQGTVTNLHLEEINEFLMPLPGIKEQKEVVKILDKIGVTLNNYNDQFGMIKSLKKKLTNSFLSGELIIPKEALK